MADLKSLSDSYAAKFAGKISVLPEFRGETTWLVDVGAVHDVLAKLKNESGFDFLVDLTGTDHLGEEPRFEVVYELFGYGHGLHLRVKTRASEDGEGVPTVTDLWQTANWHEREAYDMIGVKFPGHPELKRILMWDGYPYFPLRRDFPLEGLPSEMPDIAFSKPAPLDGGPFVTQPADFSHKREPRSKTPN
jgi:NADH-quinone oxidoreductase subunit C